MSSRAWLCGLALCSVAAGLGCDAETDSIAVVAAAPRDGRSLAQQVLTDLPPHDQDRLTFDVALDDPSGHALDRFERALDRAARQEHVVRIVAYGGSHTASDLYTGLMRSRLQRVFGDGGHGFSLALPPVTGYWQEGVRISEGQGWDVLSPSTKRTGIDRYGLVGIAFDASRDAWARVETEHSRATTITLLFMRQPGGGALEMRIDGEVHTVQSAGERIEGATMVFSVPDGEHQVELRALGDGPLRIFGVAFDRETAGGVIVDQLGLAGGKARHLLLWDEEVWRGLLQTRAPDLFLLSYGNNELDDHHLALDAYEVHFASMLERLRRVFPDADCVVIGPSDRRYPGPEIDGVRTWKTPSLLATLAPMQRRVGLAHGCAFFDTLAWQGGDGAVERWLAAEPSFEREDRIHFNEEGYRRLGAALLRGMLSR